MSAAINGGQAFPVPHSIDGNWVREPREEFGGMRLRDYFAAKALQGICASSPSTAWSDELIAGESYRLADAMLAARCAP